MSEQKEFEKGWDHCKRCKARRPSTKPKDGCCDDLAFCTAVARPVGPVDNIDQLVHDLERHRE